jgi:hypothetical protein
MLRLPLCRVHLLQLSRSPFEPQDASGGTPRGSCHPQEDSDSHGPDGRRLGRHAAAGLT